MGRSGLLSVTVWSQGRRVPRPFTFLIFIYILSTQRRGKLYFVSFYKGTKMLFIGGVMTQIAPEKYYTF
jgi:hypothetical protein